MSGVEIERQPYSGFAGRATAGLSSSFQVHPSLLVSLVQGGRVDFCDDSDAAGDDAGEASDADGISVSLGDAAGGTTHTITFNVTIN